MRTGMWLAALGLGLAWGSAAHAQQALTFGPVVGPLQYKVITGDASKFPIGGTWRRSTNFSLSSLFPNITRLTAFTTPGTTTFPTRGQLPGLSYLHAFQAQYALPAH